MHAGYIASALVKTLVDDGAHVRATVRRPEAGQLLHASLSSLAKGKLEIAIVEDITAAGAFKTHLDGACVILFADLDRVTDPALFAPCRTATPVLCIAGITHVFHMASPLPGEGKTDAKRDFLDPAINGTLSLLQDAHESASVQKVVLTSSIASILNPDPNSQNETRSEADWNPITYEMAIGLGDKLAEAYGSNTAEAGTIMQLSMAIYAASKKVAEESAWNFVKQHKPRFQLAAVNPAFVVGRPSLPLGLTGTNGMLWQTLVTRPVQPDNRMAGYVDLRDTVLGHLRAMERDEANGRRFLLVGSQPSSIELIRTALRHRADLPFGDVDGDDGSEDRYTVYNTTAAQEVLGIQFTQTEKLVADFVDWAVEVQKQ